MALILSHEIAVTAVAYHRNGCFGAPFYCVWFTHQPDEGDEPRMLQAVVFDAPGSVAVTSAKVRETWRGDEFECALRAYIDTEECQRRAFA